LTARQSQNPKKKKKKKRKEEEENVIRPPLTMAGCHQTGCLQQQKKTYRPIYIASTQIANSANTK